MSRLQELIQKFCPDGVKYRKLGDKRVCVMQRGTAITKKDIVEGNVPVIAGGQKPAYYCDRANRTGETITIAGSGAYAGFVSYWDTPIFVSDAFSIKGTELCTTKYLYYLLVNMQDKIFATKNGAGIPHVHIKNIENFKVPVPHPNVQEEIVRILDAFTSYAAELQAELQARKEQYAYYRDQLLTFDEHAEGVEWKKLGEVLHSIRTGLNPRNFFKLNTPDATSYYVTIREFNGGNLIFTESTDRINETARELCNNRSHLECNDVLFSGTGTIGETYVIDNTPSNWNIKEGVYSLKPKIHLILPKYLKYILSQSEIKANYIKLAEGGTVKSISMKKLGNFSIPIPPIQEQQRIVSILDKFEALVNDLTEGLPAVIAAVQKQYEYYRNKLLSFPKITEA